MEQALRVRLSGPLAGCRPELIEHLAGLGYGHRSITDHVRCLAYVSGWLEREGLDTSAVDERLIEQLMEVFHRAGKARKLRPCSFGVVVRFLREQGIIPPTPPAPMTPVEELLADYRHYLVAERGLAASTISGYVGTASSFLAETCANDPDRVVGLSARDVASFVLRVAEAHSRASVTNAVVGARSLLRWLYLVDRIDKPLAQAAPWLARRRTVNLPRGLEAGQAQALLGACDLDTLTGLRDFAVLTVLVRLGLRAGEVVAMEVGDIDWRRGELTVRGKGGWRDPLPLPVDVGEALAAYLARRGPEAPLRHVFFTVRPPLRPLTMTNLRTIVRVACLRAGLPPMGAHRLRHGVAVGMLAKGAPLHEIGQVLRHRHLKTTSLYAGVDFAALATIAQPWPGSEA